MSVQSPAVEIIYPESDGKPMAETDLHRDWMVRIIDLFKERFRGEQVYVSGDLIVYYVEGNPRKSVVPDAFIVKDCDPGRRRVFKTWEEHRVPNLVLETTSKSTRKKDTRDKPAIFAALGVPEYFLYDPTADYLDPPLVGMRLVGDSYEPIVPNEARRLVSQELGAELFLEDGQLVMCDARTGERLLTEAEAAHAQARTARAESDRLRQMLREHGLSKE
jgi:Uma2 family endonuclease